MIPGGLITTLFTSNSGGGFSVVPGIPLDLKFNGTDGSTTIVNDGTYTGPVTANATLNAANAAVGTACLSVNSSLVYPADASLTLASADFTIEFWVLLTSRGMFGSVPVQGTGWNINLGNTLYNQSSWLSYDNQWASHWGGNGPGWGELPLNTWKYVTLTRKGAEVYTHLDGVYVSSVDIGAATTLTGTDTIDGITLGFPEGYIDNFKLTIGTAVYDKGVDFSVGTVKAGYRFSSVPASINEGSAGTFTVYPQGMDPDTTLYWAINNVTTTDADFDEISGSFVYTGSAASFTVTPLADSVTEGNETFTVSIRTGSTTGPVILTSTPTTVVDSSQAITYAFSSAPTAVDEGVATTYSVATTGIANGTTLYWTVVNATSSAADFSATSGSFAVNSNTGSFNITATADVSNEGAELFAVEVRTGSATGPIVLTSSPITINDTSVGKSYVLTAPSTINEGSAGTFTVTTTGISNGTVYYWRVNTLTSASSDFSATTGTVTINNNTGTFSITPVTDSLVEGDETFTVSLKTSTFSSATILVTSDVVTVVDTTVLPTATFTNLPASITENGDAIYFSTTGLTNSSKVYWKINHITTNDSDFTKTTGSTFVNNNNASFYLYMNADKTTEGAESFTVSLMIGSASGTVIATSDPISLSDTSITPTYAVSVPGSLNEGVNTTVTVTTAGVAYNTTLYWTIETNTGDFAITSGNFTVSNNTGTFTVKPTADWLTEGAETFTVAIRINSKTGAIVATSDPFTINDTSVTPVYSFTVTPTAISKGDTGVFTMTSSSVPTATLYWSIDHITTTSADFTETSGTFYIVNNTGSFGIDIPLNISTDTSKTFTVSIRSGSQSGTLENVSDSVAVIQAPLMTPADPPNANVAFLLHANDVNGSTTYYDSSYVRKIIARAGTGNQVSTAQSKFGGSSLLLSTINVANYLSATATDMTSVGVKDFTVEAWVRPSGIVAEGGIVSAARGAVGSNTYKLVQSGSTWKAEVYSGTNVYTITGGTVEVDTWQHVAMSRAGNLLKLFVNGLIVGKAWLINPTTKASATLNSSSYFYIGNVTNSSSTNFYGYLDDVRVTNGTAVYTGDFNVPSSQLTDPRVISYGKGYMVGGSLANQFRSYRFTDETYSAVSGSYANPSRLRLAGVNSLSKGYFAGGSASNASVNTINSIDFSNEQAAALSATLAVARQKLTGYNSSERGYFVGGQTAGTGAAVATATMSSEIDGLVFSTEAAMNPSATLAAAKQDMAGFNSSVKGYATGANATGGLSSIDAMQFSTETNNTLANTLGIASRFGAGINSQTKGYVGGNGTDEITGVSGAIESLSFDTETASTISATLSQARRRAAGMNSLVKGYFAAGYKDAYGYTSSTVVDSIEFSTETAAVATAMAAATEHAAVQSGAL